MDLNRLDNYFQNIEIISEDDIEEETGEKIFTPISCKGRVVSFGTLLYYMVIRYFIYLVQKLEELALILGTPQKYILIKLLLYRLCLVRNSNAESFIWNVFPEHCGLIISTK